MPSWFGVQVVDGASGLSPMPPSTSAGPQVPSALQNFEAQSSSTWQVSALLPLQAALMLQSSKNQSGRVDMRGTLRPW
jgi:hypothetical protein